MQGKSPIAEGGHRVDVTIGIATTIAADADIDLSSIAPFLPPIAPTGAEPSLVAQSYGANVVNTGLIGAQINTLAGAGPPDTYTLTALTVVAYAASPGAGNICVKDQNTLVCGTQIVDGGLLTLSYIAGKPNQTYTRA